MSTPRTQFDISDIAEPPPSAPRSRSAPSGYTYRLGSGVRTPDEQAQKVAQGYSKTYDSRHLTGSARDVLAFDSSGRYIKDGSHPAYQTLGDVYREQAVVL